MRVLALFGVPKEGLSWVALPFKICLDFFSFFLCVCVRLFDMIFEGRYVPIIRSR